jgi:predicted DNA-binding transcriptional regulator AlpA
VPRAVNPSLLVGAAEIADRLGVSMPQVVHTWRRRHADFPKPVAVLQLGHIWYWPDVEKWARQTGRLA